MSGSETIEMLGNLGDFIGGIVMIATIIYLAIQVRHTKASVDANTLVLENQERIARAQARTARAQAAADNFQSTADSQFIIPALLRATAPLPDLGPPFDQLDREDATRVHFNMLAIYVRYENEHYQIEQGYGDPETRDMLDRLLRGYIPRWEAIGIGTDAPTPFGRYLTELKARSNEARPDDDETSQ